MSISEEGSITSGSDCFWEIGQYKRSVKRIDDGLRLCHDLIGLIKDRGEIEAAYAKSLRAWKRSWAEKVEKGPEYGTIEAAWRGVLEEAEKRCELHLRIRDRLVEEVANTIKIWQKDNFHKTTLGALKESKEIEEAFRKAQKPWSKLYLRVDKAKKDYHLACKAERSAQNQEKNAQNDTSVSQDQVKKLHDRVERCAEDKEKLKDVYAKALKELSDYNGRYIEDMTYVFEKCQDMEQKRLKFFKEMLFGIHKCLDLSKEARLKQIYEEFAQTIEMSDASQDLRWWSQNSGTGMAMNWPIFEEYSEDLHSISNSRVNIRSHVAEGGGIQLTGLNVQKLQKEFIEYTPELRQISKKHNNAVAKKSSEPVMLLSKTFTNGSPTVHANAFANDNNNSNHYSNNNNNDIRSMVNGASSISHSTEYLNAKSQATTASTLTQPSSSIGAAPNGTATPPDAHNPYADDWDGEGDVLHDNGDAGVPVRALYDYVGAESDELSFKKGEVFEKLEEEDEQGWCKGRKDKRIGLYPANYVELATSK